jgi:hypothetical protein
MASPQMTKVDSSMISAVGYDEDSRELLVEFSNGSVYGYKNVPQPVFVDMVNSASAGKFFKQNVKPKFSFERK